MSERGGALKAATGHKAAPGRLCVCKGDVDPMSRMGKRGAMLTDEFCEACYTLDQVVRFREHLVLSCDVIPWVLAFLSTSLPLLAFAPLLGRWRWVLEKVYSTARYASGISISVCLLVLAFGTDWNVFKSLCMSGHGFDQKYRVEVFLSDDHYFELCAYGKREDRIVTLLTVVIVLDVATLVTVWYMTSLREEHVRLAKGRKMFERLRILGRSANPIRVFDSRSAEASAMRRPLLRMCSGARIMGVVATCPGKRSV